MACGAPGQTLGELAEGKGPLPRGRGAHHHGYFCQPRFPQTLPLLTTVGRLPTRPQTAASCGNSWLWSTPCIREGSSPLTPEDGSTPFRVYPPVHLPLPSHRKGRTPEPLEDGGRLSKADASLHHVGRGRPQSRLWPQVE